MRLPRKVKKPRFDINQVAHRIVQQATGQNADAEKRPDVEKPRKE